MKILVSILFLVQLITLSIYGMIVFHHNIMQDVLGGNRPQVFAVFNEGNKFEDFFEIVKLSDIEISRAVFVDSSTIELYTSDLTLGGKVNLRYGNWPRVGYREFISNFITDKHTNSGYFYDILPNFRLSIRPIEDIIYVGVDGIYTVLSLYSVPEIDLIQLFGDTVLYISVGFGAGNFIEVVLFRLLGSFSGYDSNEMVLFLLVNFLIFLCIIVALISQSISKLKIGSILRAHGFSDSKIIKELLSGNLKYLLLATTLMYVVLSSYYFYITYLSLARN